jgi:hypothetical protein
MLLSGHYPSASETNGGTSLIKALLLGGVVSSFSK